MMRILLIILLAVLSLLQWRLWFGEGSKEHMAELERRIAEQEALNTKLIARNQSLLNEILDLKTGNDAIEERARSELGLIRPDETFYILEESATSSFGEIDASRENANPISQQSLEQ
jgi:cell division protein FtsB